MGKKIVVRTGDRFGRLTVIKELDCPSHLKPSHRLFLTVCDCGNNKEALLNNLRRGLTQSCGCLGYERRIAVNTHHGQSHSRLWKIWVKMRERCFDPRRKGYDRYGGRGITVCDEWLVFVNFYKWSIEHGYREDLTIDRINNDGNYTPHNCRWTTNLVQQNNRGDNVKFMFNGRHLTIPQICRELNIPSPAPGVIWNRIHRDGKTFDEAMSYYKEYAESVLTNKKGNEDEIIG